MGVQAFFLCSLICLFDKPIEYFAFLEIFARWRIAIYCMIAVRLVWCVVVMFMAVLMVRAGERQYIINIYIFRFFGSLVCGLAYIQHEALADLVHMLIRFGPG